MCGSSGLPDDVICRLDAGVDARNRYRIFMMDPNDRMHSSQQISEALRDFRRTYPDGHQGFDSPTFHRDIGYFRQLLIRGAADVAGRQLARMSEVVDFYRDQYVEGTNADVNLRNLFFAIRAWLPFVSHAPFIVTQDPIDRSYWDSTLPSGPDPPAVPPSFDPDDEDLDADITGEERSLRRTAAQRERTLESYVRFRIDVTGESPSSPRMLALASRGEVRPNSMQRALYEQNPVLILLPSVATPRQLSVMLGRPIEEALAELRRLVTRATSGLARSRMAFRDEVGDLLAAGSATPTPQPQDTVWQRLMPIRLATAEMLIPSSYAPNSAIRIYAQDIFGDMEPVTLSDVFGYLAIGVSVVVAFATAGASLPATTALLIAVAADAALVGVGTYLVALENARRRELNQFTSVDAALEVASPEQSLATEALFMAASYLVPVAIGAGARSARAAFLRRIVRQSELQTARRAAATVGDAVEATSRTEGRIGDRLAASARPSSGRPAAASHGGIDAASRALPDRAAASPGGQSAQPSVAVPASARAAPGADPSRTVASGAQSGLTITGFLIGPQQQRTLGRLLGRLMTNTSPSHVTGGLNAAHTAALQAAEQRAAELVNRIRTHWEAALPRGRSALDRATEVLDHVRQTNPANPNDVIRERFFNQWRVRAMRRIARDEALVRDLVDDAGVVVATNPQTGTISFRLRARGADGQRVHVWLDVDHATIGHATAVDDALRTGDPTRLLSTVDSGNLQLLTARENRNVIEPLRRDAARWPDARSAEVPHHVTTD